MEPARVSPRRSGPPLDFASLSTVGRNTAEELSAAREAHDRERRVRDMRLRRAHLENQGEEARAPTTDARTAAQRRARDLLSDAARTALRDADTVARRRARAELSPDRRNAIAAAAAEHDRARRPRLSEIAANATASAGSGGPLTLDAVAVSPAQLADRERDPIAALLALSQYSADFTCGDELVKREWSTALVPQALRRTSRRSG